MCRHLGIWVRCKAFPDTSRISWRPLAKAQSDILGRYMLKGARSPLEGAFETFLETSGTLRDALGRFRRLPKHSRTLWNNFKLTTKLSEPSRRRWIDETCVFCDPRASRKRLVDIPGGFQDARGRFGTLLEASRTLLDAVGRAWKLPVESRTAQEGPNTTPVVSFGASKARRPRKVLPAPAIWDPTRAYNFNMM